MELPAAKRQFSTSQSKEISGAGACKLYGGYPQFPTDVYRRQASSYSVPSSELSSRTSIRSSGSFKAAAQRVTSVFSSCFVHRKVKIKEEREVSQECRSEEYHVSTNSAGQGQESTVLTIADISRATSNFSHKNLIRQGTSRSIYKGKLKDGSQIAIKCAKKIDGQYLSAELQRELQTLPKIEHLNLVRFIGYLEHKDESLIIVEDVSNGSLREHLDESCGNGLELVQRLNIAIDIAHAITYLHEYADQPIIHRDISSSNVLLTDALTAKVTGFGLARMADDPEATHISTKVKGTAGYVDPEYLSTYQLTDKSDVYSFGVLLVELVTGRPPIERRRDLDARVSTKWALQRYRAGEAVVAMDPRMRRSPASVAAVEKMMGLAERCVAPARGDRPSMRRCTEALWTLRRDYHRRQETPPRPAAVVEDRSSDSEWVVREDR